jgi:NADPH:quinone reductase-like Zn-dependent oxidoreductase
MRAAFYDKLGPAKEVLQVGNLPDPAVGPGEVRVRIHASGVNPTDTKRRSGWAGSSMGEFARIIPHQDGAGVIDLVGPGVSQTRLGERVWIYEAQWGRAGGTAADWVVVPADNAVPLPDGISFAVGACLGIAAMTAHRCLFADGALQGQWVLVQGGAGAVGLAAILLAKWAGARVATTVSREEQANIVRQAGADLIINRKTEDIAARVLEATAGAGVTRIVDVALPENIDIDLACIATNGAITAYAADSASASITLPFRIALYKGAVIRFVLVYHMPRQAHLDAVRDINSALAAGVYQPVIALRLPLDKIAEAHDAQDSGNIIGKIIIEIPVEN